jgi:hypothetical protein
MANPKSPPAARVSAANALLDRGYGKPPQHITDESARSFVARLPEPCKTAEEWEAWVKADLPSKFACIGSDLAKNRAPDRRAKEPEREVSKELAARGYLNERGKPYAAKSIASMLG